MPSKEDYERFFRNADKDNSGTLSVDELVTMLRKQGYTGTDTQIKGMFRSVDASGDGQISKDEYLQAMGAVPPNVHESSAARRCFQEFDQNGDGTISNAELAEVFKAMGKQFPPDQINRMVELCDSDGDGSISYEEFVQKIFGGRG